MPMAFEQSALYDEVASVHNIVINEDSGFAFAVGSNSGGETCGGGLHMIDIRDQLNPTFAGLFCRYRDRTFWNRIHARCTVCDL